MDVLDLARIMIYRMHEKGLEVFLIRPELDEDPDIWKLPSGISNADINSFKNEIINLEGVKDAQGLQYNFIAVEGDWHDIPSIRGIIKHDIKRAHRKLKSLLPDLNNGLYIGVNEITGKVYPHEQEAVSELQEILSHRSLLSNI